MSTSNRTQKHINQRRRVLIACALVAGLFARAKAADELAPFSFVEQPGALCPDGKNLRKWDAPVVADLDQDGWNDLLLNDHGYGIRVVWNNRGKLAKPYDLVIGDMHGVAVGDIDQDGLLEIIVSRGGGSGSNARNAKVYRVSKERAFTEAKRLNEPLKAMRGRTLKLLDADGDGDLDLLNFSFPTGGKSLESENYIYRNEGQGQFTIAGTLPASIRDGQKTLVTDFNNDATPDLLVYGQGRLLAYVGRDDLSFRDVTDSTLPTRILDTTSIVEIDYDNDGDFDLYVARGREFKAGATFYSAETKSLGFFNKRGRFRLDDFAAEDVIELKNYQAQWPNKKLFIGESAYEYEFEGETHSGRDLKLVNSDALGWPDSTDPKGSYLGYVGNGNWRFEVNIWSPTTGVLTGVNAYQESEHTPGPSDLLLENRDGVFVDVSQEAGVGLETHTVGVACADFDNNGHQDLLAVCRGRLVVPNHAILYQNNGDKTFSLATDHGIVAKEMGAIGLGVGAFDYNADGRVDAILGAERGLWRLFANRTNQSRPARYTTVAVGASPRSKASPLGALIEIVSGQNRQLKRIGSTGASYSSGYNAHAHFGLGRKTSRVDVKVTWPNGEVLEAKDLTSDKIIYLGGDKVL